MPEQRPQQLGKLGRRWKRTAAMTLLLLAGGAVVNVAVAWGLAAWVSQDAWGDEAVADLPNQWPVYLQRLEWPAPASATQRDISVGVRIIEVAGDDVDAWILLEVRQFGVPVRALQFESHGASAGTRGMQMAAAARDAAGVRAGIDVSRPFGDGSIVFRRLPLIPIVPGFIINTIFYAMLLWLLFFAPFAARRMLRRRRGQCAKCAYPIGASPVCTECGAAVTSHGRTPT